MNRSVRAIHRKEHILFIWMFRGKSTMTCACICKYSFIHSRICLHFYWNQGFYLSIPFARLFACLLLAIIFITSDADDIIYKQNMHMDNNHEPSCYMHRAAPRRILNQCIRMYEIGCNVKTCLEFVCVSRLTWTLLVILASFAHLFVRRNTLNCIFRVHLPVK